MGGLVRLSFLLLLSAVAAQVSVVWDGSTHITGPVLIYHDEIVWTLNNITSSSLLAGSRALVCSSATGEGVGWHLPDGWSVRGTAIPLLSARPTFYQQRDSSKAVLVRGLGTSVAAADHNGLWTCRLNGSAEGAIPVGLYQRGLGRITTNHVYLSSSSFLSDSPNFTLVGRTSGGPPTASFWLRDGAVITDGGSFSISLSVNKTSIAQFRQSVYVSTLTVTGRLPGEYKFSASNRDHIFPSFANKINIEGGAVSNLTAVQTGLATVLVNWTAPSAPPARGYLITVASAIINETTLETSHVLAPFSPGVYTIQVQSLSQHYPGEAASVVTVRDGSPCPPVVAMSSLTATSVTVSLTQPEFTIPVLVYTVSLTRVTGSGQVLCTDIRDDRPAVGINGTSISYTGLEEASIYIVNITPNLVVYRTISTHLITLSDAPTGAPRTVVPSVTSRSIMVTWDVIECIERNGEITGYTVEFQEQGGASIPGEVMGQSFTASGLTPHTNYTFRVAGVNSIGTGPFTNTSTFTTREEVLERENARPGVSTFAAVSISVVVSSLLTILLYTTVLLVVGAVCRHSRKAKGTHISEREGNGPAIYEEVNTANVGADIMEMKANTAYGPVFKQ